jgi:predicted RNA binding protein YcfA (HicA-like mRNA interferase family)
LNPSLPTVSGRAAVAAFEKAGFEIKRQTGSHIILAKSGAVLTLSVPDHRALKPGTLRALIRKSGLSVAEFTELLR